MPRITYKDIPLGFKLSNKNKAIEYCDMQTPMSCYCGRLATGLHTSSCRKFQSKVQSRLLELYKKELENASNDKSSSV